MATYKCRISIMIGSNSTGNLVDCITIQNEILLEGKRGGHVSEERWVRSRYGCDPQKNFSSVTGRRLSSTGSGSAAVLQLTLPPGG